VSEPILQEQLCCFKDRENMFRFSSQPAKGPWSITLHPYMYRKFLEYCPDRALRWNVYQAKVSVGSATHDVASNVSGQVRDVRQYRQDQAATLGFANFADMSMETKMAANVENVHSMVACLLGKGESGINHSAIGKGNFVVNCSQGGARKRTDGAARLRGISRFRGRARYF
jgi:Zn-dependent oligopeptidase